MLHSHKQSHPIDQLFVTVASLRRGTPEVPSPGRTAQTPGNDLGGVRRPSTPFSLDPIEFTPVKWVRKDTVRPLSVQYRVQRNRSCSVYRSGSTVSRPCTHGFITQVLLLNHPLGTGTVSPKLFVYASEVAHGSWP